MTAESRILSMTLVTAAFEDATVGRCLVAPDGTVVRANAEWLRSTGFSEDQVVGADIVGLFPATRDMALALHARARAGHRVEVPPHAQTVNGRELWWEGRIEPVAMEGGTGLLITAREIRGLRANQEHTALAAQRQLALDAAQMGWWHYDPVTRIVSHDARCGSIFGVTGERRPNDEVLKLVHPQDLTRVWSAVKAALDPRRRERYSADYRVVRPDGGVRWVEAHGVATFGGDGPGARATSLVGTVQDVTERRAVEESLRESTALVRAISDTSGDVIFAKDVAGRLRFANPATLALIGKPLSEVIGRTDAELLTDPAAAREVMANDRRIMETGVAEDLEERVPLPDGTERVWYSRKVPYRDDSGRVIGLLGISRDITDRKRIVEELRVRDAQFRALIAELYSGVALIDATGKFAVVNRRFLEMFGLPSDAEIRNVNDQDWGQWQVFDEGGRLLPLDEHPVRRAASTGSPVRGEVVGVRSPAAGDDLTWMTVSAEPLRADDGSIAQIICTYHDITDRKLAEEELRRSEAALEAFFAASPGILNLEDEEFRYVKTDPLTPTYFGLTRDTIAGKSVAELAPDFIAEFGPMMRRVIETGEPAMHQLVHSPVPGRHGEVAHWSASYFPVPLPGGKRGLGVMGVEITEMVRAEAALRDANERLLDADRRKDDFLAMLAHELRNPLAPIRNSSYMLRHAPPSSDQARRAQEVIERQTQHLTRLVDDLLDVTRIARGKIELRRSRVDLREVVARAADDFRLLMRDRGVRFEVAVPDVQLWAEADATRITQVVGNLLHNASKFTRSGDEVVLSMGVVGGVVEVSVRDTGAGIDAALLPRVFDAFTQGERTLARSEGGLGLGLALVKAITELHGGTVEARSAGKGRGSEFVVRLPLPPAAQAPADSSPGAERVNGGRRVLVVDDNADAAESMADILGLLGHTVDVAYDGPGAIAKARANPPDIVLCDIGLPGMSGYDVARALRGAGLAAQLFAVSGYAQPEDVRRALEAGFDGHLAKPPRIEDIERLLA